MSSRVILSINFLHQFISSTINFLHQFAYRPSSILTILTNEPIGHQAYWPSKLSTIEPINHRAYQPSSLSTIVPIVHQAYWQTSLSTSGLLSQLLCLLACFFLETKSVVLCPVWFKGHLTLALEYKIHCRLIL